MVDLDEKELDEPLEEGENKGVEEDDLDEDDDEDEAEEEEEVEGEE